MNRTPINSSNICSVGYETETTTLEVEFHSTGVYQYSGVPDSVYQDLMLAASKGAYFHNHIKDRYPCRQVG